MTTSMAVYTESFLKPEPWTRNGACLEVNPDMFFPGKGDHRTAREAREVCDRCTERIECLAYAMRNREREGIWGGKTARERQTLRAGQKACWDCSELAPAGRKYCEPCRARRRRASKTASDLRRNL